MLSFRALALSISMVFASALVAQASDWNSMEADRFPATVKAADGQCVNHVLEGTSSLTLSDCSRFVEMLEQDECTEVMVPDGVWYALMGSTDSHDHTISVPNMRKQLGKETKALECQIRDGVVLHWITGDDESCNNVALVGKPPVVKQSRRVNPKTGRMTVVGSRSVPGMTVVQETVHVHTCGCGHIVCGESDTVTFGRVIPNLNPATGHSPVFSFD